MHEHREYFQRAQRDKNIDRDVSRAQINEKSLVIWKNEVLLIMSYKLSNFLFS